MAAEQHDFILQLRVGAREIRDDVIAVRVRGEVARRDSGAQLYRNALLDQADDHVVVLGRENH